MPDTPAQKAKAIAGIKARSIKKYGAGKMQRSANLEATYQRSQRSAKGGIGTPATGKPMGQRTRPTTQPMQRPKGPGVIPLRKPGAAPKPAGQRAPITRPASRPTPVLKPPSTSPGQPRRLPYQSPGSPQGQLQGNGAGPYQPKPPQTPQTSVNISFTHGAASAKGSPASPSSSPRQAATQVKMPNPLGTLNRGTISKPSVSRPITGKSR